jgi:beta-lactamase class C
MQPLRIYIPLTLLIATLFALAVGTNPGDSPNESEWNVATGQPGRQALEQVASEATALRKETLRKALAAYFKKAIASGDIVGAGVSIVKEGEILFSDGFGRRNARQPGPVDGETIFRLGSLSKGFTGILAANIKYEGGFDWEDRVADYIPGFMLGDQGNTRRITLAHLLSHTSGAPYHSYTNLVEAGLPIAEIASRFKEVEPISAPGELYSYQNALFALSGAIIQKASGQEVDEAFKSRLFNPLEMCATNMDHESLLAQENVALPHYRSGRGWKPKKLVDNYYNAIPAGGINASAVDMGRWMRFLLGYNPEVMPRHAIEEAFTPVVEIPGSSKYYQRWPGHLSSHYGFGWRIHKFKEGASQMEKTIWHHGGSVNDFRNEIAIFPEADLGICVLLNSNSKLSRTVIPDVYAIIGEVYAESLPAVEEHLMAEIGTLDP